MHCKTLTLGLAVGALALAGCATSLVPARAANELPGPAAGAVARAQGVEMVARAGAWDGVPSNLAERLTPMLVTITNHADVPVRVRYSELMLQIPGGRVLKALPPFAIDGKAAEPIATYYPPREFVYAPYFSPFVPGATIYPGDFALDPIYSKRYGTVLRSVDLPSTDMLQRAMPEGVLQPRGQVTGFVYFPGVSEEVQRVRLRGDFVNADTGRTLVSLSIPFVVS